MLCYIGQGNITAAMIPERRAVTKTIMDLSDAEKARIKEDLKVCIPQIQ